MQLDWFLSVLEQKWLGNHEIYYIEAAKEVCNGGGWQATPSITKFLRSCWVGPGISTLRTSPRMEVHLVLCYKSFYNLFGGVQKLRLQDEIGRWLSKCQHMSTNVNRGLSYCGRMSHFLYMKALTTVLNSTIWKWNNRLIAEQLKRSVTKKSL